MHIVGLKTCPFPVMVVSTSRRNALSAVMKGGQRKRSQPYSCRTGKVIQGKPFQRAKKMVSRLIEVFEDEKLVAKIKKRLPYLFQVAELESSRAGKAGMEVGSPREKIITALLIYKFGDKNVEINIPITEREVDLKLFG